MQLTPAQLSKIESTLFNRIRDEFEKANDKNIIEQLIEKYDISFDPEPVTVFPKIQKILVIGDVASVSKCIGAAKSEYGIDPDHIEFHADYSKLGRFDVETLKDSDKYSDIILGPVPHSQKGKGDNSSLKAAILKESHRYPRFLPSKDLTKPLSKSEFIYLLGNTRYVEAMRLGN